MELEHLTDSVPETEEELSPDPELDISSSSPQQEDDSPDIQEEPVSPESEQEADSSGILPDRTGPLPAALVNVRLRNYLIGFVVLVFAIGFAFAERDWRIMTLGLFGLWFFYVGFTIDKRYRTGQIEEILMVCTSAHKSVLRNSVTVGFRTDDEYPVFYSFEVGSRKSIDAFHPNGVYFVYFDKDTPSQLLAYSQV